MVLWHFEQIASGKVEWPRRLNPAEFSDDLAAAKGYPGVVDRLSDQIRRRVAEKTPPLEIGFLWWCPGGITHSPTQDRPEHFEYPDRPFHAARQHITSAIEAYDPSGERAPGAVNPMRKAGDVGAFASSCRRLLTLGVRRIAVYIGRPTQVDPDLLDLIAAGLVTDVMFDNSAHQPPLPHREPVMLAYEAAGADIWYEAVPSWAGPGSDLRHSGRGCVSILDQWDALQARETGQLYHPSRNPPAGFFPKVLLLDRHDTPNLCTRHLAAGRSIACNFNAPAWKAVALADLM